MSSVKPIDYETSSGHSAGIMNTQAKDWLSAETRAHPFASHSKGSQEGMFGWTDDRGPSERDASMSALDRRHNSHSLPNEKA
eukprot:3114687-Pyramimonas_sp.AAC.2